MLRPKDLSIISHSIYPTTASRVSGVPLVTPYEVLTRLRRAKETSRDPLLIIADLRETRLYQLGHVITALSTNCYTKTMAKRAVSFWDSTFAHCNGCPAKIPENQSNETFCSQLPQTNASCVVVYDQHGDYLPNEMPTDSSIYFFISHLTERGNSVFFMVGGFSAFQSLRSQNFIDSGPPVISNCHQQSDNSTTGRVTSRAANSSSCALTTVKSSPPCSRNHQPKQYISCDNTSGMNLLRLVSRSLNDTQKKTGRSDQVDYSDQTVEDVFTASVSKILPFLYLGNARDAQNLDLLCRLSITHIVNVTDSVPMPFTSCSTSPPFIYLHLPASDTSQQDLRPAFERAVKFISDARSNRGIVLVHCQAGVSRSVAVVMAYLLYADPNLSVLDALEFVQRRRSVAGPNLHFMGQLQRYRCDLDQRLASATPPLSSQRNQSTPASLGDEVVDSLFADIAFQFEA